jgi:hypothetical protein
MTYQPGIVAGIFSDHPVSNPAKRRNSRTTRETLRRIAGRALKWIQDSNLDKLVGRSFHRAWMVPYSNL